MGRRPCVRLLSGVHCLQPCSALPTPPLPDASDPRTASPCSVLPLGEKRATDEKEEGHCTFGENHCRAMRGVLLRRACRCPFPPVLALTPHPQASAVVRGHTVRAKYWYTVAEATTGRGGQVTAGGGGASLHCQGLWLWAPGLATSTSAVLSSSTGRLQGPNMNIHGKSVCSCLHHAPNSTATRPRAPPYFNRHRHQPQSAPTRHAAPPPVSERLHTSTIPTPAPVPRLSLTRSQPAVSPAPGRGEATAEGREGCSLAEESHCRARQGPEGHCTGKAGSRGTRAASLHR